MKKLIKITLLFSVGVVILSCSDFLDREPLNVVSDEKVWEDPDAIDAYMVTLYDEMELEDFDYQTITEAGFLSTITDIAVRSYEWGAQNDPTIPTNQTGWWGYSSVRKVNEFLEKIEDAELDEDQKEQFIAEAHFIRAYYYFSMVKRYGGVPIIEEAQEYEEGNVSELQVPRDTEKEVYDFIREELNLAIEGLPEIHSSDNENRINKFGALALMSRAMLYAGSSGSYSDVGLDGLVGIDQEDADAYYEYALAASEEIMNSSTFSLFDESDDKVQNYQELFLSAEGNPEVIFAEIFHSSDKGHSYDFYNAPDSYKVDYGSVINPTLSFVEEFEYTNGDSGELKIEDGNGNPIHYDDPYDLFKDKDPRLKATVLLPFDNWQDGTLEIRRGIIDGNDKITSSNLEDSYGSGSDKVTITGKDGPTTVGDPTKTGFYIKKSMNPVDRVEGGRSDQPWIVFRYAEILLNYAEAAVELGVDEEGALGAINQIRDRAGIAELNELDLDKVRHERKVELAFENHRFWDIRRWRVGTELLNNTQFKALYPWLNWDTKDYTFTIEDAPKNPRTFLKKLYYEPIPEDEIQKNPNLKQNPDY